LDIDVLHSHVGGDILAQPSGRYNTTTAAAPLRSGIAIIGTHSLSKGRGGIEG
jgi:hypothetical protein